MPKSEISSRAKRVWQRLAEWYGTRLVEQYGEAPPNDWRELVDGLSDHAIREGLANIRKKYIAHPPTLPQFEEAMRPRRPDHVGHVPNVAERLCEYVTRHYWSRMTDKQFRGPWTYIGQRVERTIIITGVVIAADGESPGYRIMVEDMQAPQVGYQPRPDAIDITKYLPGNMGMAP